MNKNYKVTIIVPVYNVEQYIEKCVESILRQNYKNIEIILVDDGSTDLSGDICDAYGKKDTRVKVIHKSNGGLSSARNTGLKIASGEYISYVDSDDYVEESFIRELLSLCVDNNRAFSCISFREFSEECENVTRKNVQPIVYNEEEFIKKIVSADSTNKITYCVWSKLFRKDIIEGLIFPEGKTYEDILYTTKAVVNAGGCVFKDIALYNYRIREGSISKSKYAEGFDTRLLTDRLGLQIEQLTYINQNLTKSLARFVKFKYYEELLNILRSNKSEKWKIELQNALEEFRMPVSEVIKLPITWKEKVKGILKMKFPKLIGFTRINKK